MKNKIFFREMDPQPEYDKKVLWNDTTWNDRRFEEIVESGKTPFGSIDDFFDENYQIVDFDIVYKKNKWYWQIETKKISKGFIATIVTDFNDGMVYDELDKVIANLTKKRDELKKAGWKNIMLGQADTYYNVSLELIGERPETKEEMKARVKGRLGEQLRAQKSKDERIKMYLKLKKEFEKK